MTAPAPTGDVAQVSSTTRRRKVEHLFWISDLETARSRRLAVVSLCGRAVERPMPARQQDNVERVGGLVPLLQTTDCRLCGRVLSRRLREQQRG